MQTLWQDVRYALRQLRKAPGFALTAIVILALGMGANAAIFTLVHAVLLRSLPVADPRMLIRLGDHQDCCMRGSMPNNDDYSLFPYDLYRHLQANSTEFEQLAAVQSAAWRMTVRSSGKDAIAQGLPSEFVSGNYFQTMGLAPFAGRLLTPADDTPGAAPVAVISYQAWQRDYALDRSILGTTFFFKTHPVTIVGVTPPSYYGDRLSTSPANFYLPFALEPILTQPSLLHDKGGSWIYILGRIKPGTELGPLQAKLSGMMRQWLALNDAQYQNQAAAKHLAATHVVLTPGGAGITAMQEKYASGLRLLMTISVLVLLIACANLANLMLVRVARRAVETSVRMALGARSARILRQMLTESILLSLMGGLAGLAVAYVGTRLLLALAFPDSPGLPIQASPSTAVFLFAFGLALFTGILFGIAPAWLTSRAQPADALRHSNRIAQGGASWLQRSLVVLQAALSLVLLIGAGLLSKSLNRLEHQDLGLQTRNRVVVHVDPDSAGYKPEQLDALYASIQNRLHAIAGVQRVAISTYSPLGDDSWGAGVVIQGKPQQADGGPAAGWLRVGPEMFDLIGQRVRQGRGITAEDTTTSPGVAVVNQAFVRKFFAPGENPVGAHFGTGDIKSAGDFTIVGVVNDAKWTDPREPAAPMFFRPMLQLAASDPAGDIRGLHVGTIMLQTAGPIDGLESQVRRTLASINANLPVDQYESFDDQIALQFVQERLIARLTMLFSGLSLVLASVGLYGVTSFTVAKRTSEIGIRMALGADRRSVVGIVLRGAMQQAGLGLFIGLPAALLCVRFVKAQMYGVEGHDLVVISSAMLALLLTALLAGFIPARRAASIDPMQALRTE